MSDLCDLPRSRTLPATTLPPSASCKKSVLTTSKVLDHRVDCRHQLPDTSGSHTNSTICQNSLQSDLISVLLIPITNQYHQQSRISRNFERCNLSIYAQSMLYTEILDITHVCPSITMPSSGFWKYLISILSLQLYAPKILEVPYSQYSHSYYMPNAS